MVCLRVHDLIVCLIEDFILEDERWVLSSTVQDEAVVALKPFNDVPFDLAMLWA